MKFKTDKGNTLTFSSFVEFVKKFSIKMKCSNFILEWDTIEASNIYYTFPDYELVEKVKYEYFNHYYKENTVKIAYLYKKSNKQYTIIDWHTIIDWEVYDRYWRKEDKYSLSSSWKEVFCTEYQFEKSNWEIANIRKHLVFDWEFFIIEEDEKNIFKTTNSDYTRWNSFYVEWEIKVNFNYNFLTWWKLLKNWDRKRERLDDIKVSKNYFHLLKRKWILEKLKKNFSNSVEDRNFLLSHWWFRFVFNQKLSSHSDWDNFFKKRKIYKKLKNNISISTKSLLKLKTFYEGNHYWYFLDLRIKWDKLIITSQWRNEDNNRKWDNEVTNTFQINNWKVLCKDILWAL